MELVKKSEEERMDYIQTYALQGEELTTENCFSSFGFSRSDSWKCGHAPHRNKRKYIAEPPM
jgi:hypothetical protein